ncbi:MAG TPA: hypothetical protein VI603_10715 [Saprospiraceae bacterium]|nr:hypothetical protein [Saprospiraceae bacterium]
MKAFKSMLAMSLFAVLTSGLFVHCAGDAITTLDKPEKVKTRSCNEVTQTYVNGIKSLAAAELSISPGSVQVGVVELITPTTGLWHDPNHVVGIVTDDFDGCLFVAFEDDPLEDAEVVGYYYDESFCVSPSSGNIVTDDIEGVLALTLNIVTDDIDGF